MGVTSRAARLGLATIVTVGLGLAAVACGSGSDGGDAGGSGDAPDGSLSEEDRGERIARSRGCAGCHGEDFDGAAGPGWVGLAGSEVELVDGTMVTADRDYLVRAIADPGADVVSGYTLQMPSNDLSDDEIAAIVAYIESLADG